MIAAEEGREFGGDALPAATNQPVKKISAHHRGPNAAEPLRMRQTSAGLFREFSAKGAINLENRCLIAR